MAKLDLTNTVIGILKENPEKSFTARELALKVLQKKPEECRAKMKRTNLENEDKLLTQLTCEISARRKRTIATPTSGIQSFEDTYPIRYQYTGKTEFQYEEDKKHHNNHPEWDMYPLLCSFLSDEDTGLALFPKRINESTSLKKKGTAGKNIWLHPDIVAFKNLSISWHKNVSKCSSINAFNKICFYSFEVKDEIATISNLREMFFQTVSNSSWAHYSYLVVPGIKDIAAREELKILCNRHNVGVIELDVTDPVGGSKITIPANRKESADWDIINRLCVENKDFEDFINTVNNCDDLSAQKIRQLLNIPDYAKED